MVLSVWQNFLDALVVGSVYDIRLTQAAFTLGGFLGQDVAAEGFVALDFSRAGCLETLCGASVGFHLWHEITPSHLLCIIVCQRKTIEQRLLL
jgi:hypothetical protein